VKELEAMYSNRGKASLFGFIFCIVSIFTLGAQNSGTLVLTPNAEFIRIYNDSACYTIARDSNFGNIGNITKTLEAGTWVVDNGYEEKRISIREGRTTNSALKPSPDYGDPVGGQRLTVIGTKDKSSAPAWLVSYVASGPEEIQGMPQYAGRYCFVADETSAHLLPENYLKHAIWQQIVSKLQSVITSSFEPQNGGMADMVSSSSTSFFEGFSSTVSASQTEYESIAKVEDRTTFESFLNRLNFRIEEFWWQKTSSKFRKGSKEEYHSYLLATVSKGEFNKALAMALQNSIDSNPAFSAAERSVYEALINEIRAGE
jgi:hypothetical protein